MAASSDRQPSQLSEPAPRRSRTRTNTRFPPSSYPCLTQATSAWVRSDTPPLVEFQVGDSNPCQQESVLVRILGPRDPIPTKTYEHSSPTNRQQRTRTRYLRRPCSTQLSGPRDDARAKDRICWDQPTSSSRRNSTRSSRPAPGLGNLLGTSITLKPKPDDTDRPLGLLPMMVRKWEKSANLPCRPGAESGLGPWDQAVERPPALRCALRCAMVGGSCRMRYGRSLFMVDLEKFYDTIRIDHLVNTALSLRALARVLLIGLMACLAPRAISTREPFRMAQSRGQHGSGISSLKHLGAHTAPTKFWSVHRLTCRPSQSVGGTTSICLRSARRCSSRSTLRTPPSSSWHSCGARGYASRPNPKSLASRLVLAKRLAFLLELEGEHLKVATVGKDLGNDFSKAATGAISTANGRTAALRARRIRLIKIHQGDQPSRCARWPLRCGRFQIRDQAHATRNVRCSLVGRPLAVSSIVFGRKDPPHRRLHVPTQNLSGGMDRI